MRNAVMSRVERSSPRPPRMRERSVVNTLAIPLRSVSMLLITSTSASATRTTSAQPGSTSSASEKSAMEAGWSSFTSPLLTAHSPKNPAAMISGTTMAPAPRKPRQMSPSVLAAYTRCQSPWWKRFAARMAITSVRPNSMPCSWVTSSSAAFSSRTVSKAAVQPPKWASVAMRTAMSRGMMMANWMLSVKMEARRPP